MMVTDYLIQKVPFDFWQKTHYVKALGEWAEPIPNWEQQNFELVKEHVGGEPYHMFNTGGVEAEVGEFLYGMVRMIQPSLVLETGTHLGISSVYLGLALKENGHGKLITIEFNPPFYLMAQALFEHLEISSQVELVRGKVERWDPGDRVFDLAFLDTEPSFRFGEMLKFYPNIKEGGLILIHDLHANLGLSFSPQESRQVSAFGDFREKIGYLIEEHAIQTVSFPSPRGLTMFQKAGPDFNHTNYLRGKL